MRDAAGADQYPIADEQPARPTAINSSTSQPGVLVAPAAAGEIDTSAPGALADSGPAPSHLGLGWSLLVLVLLVSQGIICFVARKSSLSGAVDFRAFYATGTIVRSGHASRIYDYTYQQQVQNAVVGPRAGALPFLYPPFAALLFVPFSLLSYRTAFAAFFLVNVGLLLLAARLIAPKLRAFHGRSWWSLPPLFGCLFAASIAVMQGQISLLLLVIYSTSFILLRRQQPLQAGMVLSLGLMKFQLAVPVLLLFLWWRQWRFALGFFAGGIGVGLVSLAMVGRSGFASYGRSMFGMASKTALDAVAAKARYGMFPTDMPNLHGLTYAISRGATWGHVLNFTLCCVVLGWAARQLPSLLVAVPAAMLVSYHMQPHDLVLLLLPLSFALDDQLRRRPKLASGSGDQMTGPPRRSPLDLALHVAVLLLILPCAGLIMVKGTGYVLSIAVTIIMVAAAPKLGEMSSAHDAISASSLSQDENPQPAGL